MSGKNHYHPKCKNCGYKNSQKRATCPKCGHDLNAKKERRKKRKTRKGICVNKISVKNNNRSRIRR